MKQRRTFLGLTFLEWIYLLLGTGGAANEIVLTQTLTLAELGLILFFYGLLASSVADRTGATGPIELIQALTDLVRGRNQ